jgi:hypothetical protein
MQSARQEPTTCGPEPRKVSSRNQNTEHPAPKGKGKGGGKEKLLKEIVKGTFQKKVIKHHASFSIPAMATASGGTTAVIPMIKGKEGKGKENPPFFFPGKIRKPRKTL